LLQLQQLNWQQHPKAPIHKADIQQSLYTVLPARYTLLFMLRLLLLLLLTALLWCAIPSHSCCCIIGCLWLYCAYGEQQWVAERHVQLLCWHTAP
jgi:hypothetical protein